MAELAIFGELAGVGIKRLSVIGTIYGTVSGVARRGEDEASSGGRDVAEPGGKTGNMAMARWRRWGW